MPRKLLCFWSYTKMCPALALSLSYRVHIRERTRSDKGIGRKRKSVKKTTWKSNAKTWNPHCTFYAYGWQKCWNTWKTFSPFVLHFIWMANRGCLFFCFFYVWCAMSGMELLYIKRWTKKGLNIMLWRFLVWRQQTNHNQLKCHMHSHFS